MHARESPDRWFDAHLDLACLAALGRAMDQPDPGVAGGPDQPGAVTLPSLREGGITHALGTIFLEPDGKDAAISYASGDFARAASAARAQLEIYRSWRARGWTAGLHDAGPADALRLGVLIEGADAIAGPDEVGFWEEAGVVAVGLAWARDSRYAGGNTGERGLSDAGRALVAALDGHGIVHDVSHLSDRSLDDLLSATGGRIIASHSNCREIVASAPARDATGPRPFQRHLRDATIREIARRGGVVGLNLFSPFILPGGGKERRATAREWALHADRVCQVVGHHHAVGLGSDMDGGFPATRLPEGIDAPRDLWRLGGALRDLGWNDDAVRALMFGNWARFWNLA